MFGNLGLPELIIIFVIILLLFGGRKLPEVGQNLGKAIRSFKDGISGAGAAANDVEKELEKDAKPEPGPARELPRQAEVLPTAEAEKSKEPARKA